MDKKRIKAWLNSVKKLLTCNFIRHLGSLLANALGRDETPTSANPSSQDYLQFLKEVLQATAYSDGNPDDVYRLLQANLNKLDDNLIAVLQNWAEATFSEVESLAAEGIALLIGSFGDLIRQFPLGNKAANVEISLASYDIVLTVFTRDSHSEIWATIQNSLGYAYLDRIKGDRGENLELAIAAYQQALEIFTQQAFPTNSAVTQNNLGNAYLDSIKGDRGENLELAIATWATTQNNLGNAYWNRIKGDRGENLELAIAAFQQALDIYTSSAFPTYWATIQNSLGNVYGNRIKGDRGENLELAIAAFQQALEIYTQESFPTYWATIQNNLGNAYLYRIKGDRGENLELAIAAYQLALHIYTQEAFPNAMCNFLRKNNCLEFKWLKMLFSKLPQCGGHRKVAHGVFPTDWAMTQNNLGNAYRNRIKGDRDENLELAIAAYQLALQIRTQEAFPTDWAMTQNNLGTAYSDRIKGNRGENLELAIAAFKHALKIYTSSAFPTDWAMTQNNLGTAYGNRIKEDRAENLELAIAAFQQALEIYTSSAFPTDWAITQNNLGNAYLDRLKGDRAENLELAIAAYQLALQIQTPSAFPTDWAITQNNLGAAYSDRIKGNRGENLELAIAAYQLALQIQTPSAFPTNWAMTQNNLGNAYLYRIKGDRAENLELAIAAYQLAFQIRTQEAFPTDWAMTQNNLGAAYSDRIKGNRGENLELAIAAYQLALHIYTPEADPIKCLATSRNLGNLHFTEGNWQPAIAAYENAIAAVELSRSWAINYKRREEIIAEAIDVYQNLVQAYINTNQWDKAIETVERSKARNLVELLAKQNLKPKGVPQEISAQLDELQRSISSLERQLQVAIDRLSTNTSGLEELQRQALEESRQQLQQEWQDSRQQLDEVLNQIKPFDPSFSLTQNEGTIRFEEIQSLVGEQTAMIEWYVTDDSIITSIITRHSSQPTIVSSSAEEREAFVDWVSKYLGAYKQYKEKRNEQWKNDLSSDLAELAEILNIDQTLAEVDSIFAPQGIKCDRLILVPHRFLHLLPLHAMPLEKGGLLCDRFDVGYAPSCQLLQLTQTQQRPDFQRLFAIQDPEENLAYSILEVETIRSFFSPATVLATKAAREEDVKTHPELSLAHCNHFSCHGEFNLESPLESALRLAEIKQSDSGSSEDGYLTLAEIFALNLTQSRLVTLSACETGIVDVSKPIDEYVSLPSGFLFAGSPSVVCSQWKADDFSTSLLMMKFYENLQLFPQRENGTVALALNQAQKWLRNLTCKDGEEFLDFIEPQWKLVIANLPEEEGERVTAAIKGARKRMLKRPPYPFANPYYWAAFTATGF